ncbi:hypothetical protein [Carnobacterium maltaromaticum]|uniref:hypothetical protein n=1 Tax=Carnobacterium maltaromaticum TaxID=2751 RepID=UPI0012F8944F|nr:hypothetical protein [Carnobacterium maltaromaticum]
MIKLEKKISFKVESKLDIMVDFMLIILDTVQMKSRKKIKKEKNTLIFIFLKLDLIIKIGFFGE